MPTEVASTPRTHSPAHMALVSEAIRTPPRTTASAAATQLHSQSHEWMGCEVCQVQQQQPAQAAARRPASAPRQRSLAATAPTYGGQQRPAVHERLYESGLMAKHKLDAERRQRERDLTAATKSDKVVMSQVRTLAGLRCLQCRCTAQHSPTAVDAALPCCTCSSRGLGMLSDVSSAGGTAAAALEWHM